MLPLSAIASACWSAVLPSTESEADSCGARVVNTLYCQATVMQPDSLCMTKSSITMGQVFREKCIMYITQTNVRFHDRQPSGIIVKNLTSLILSVYRSGTIAHTKL